MNWAVVIGIDRYWKEDACLKGAVRDALTMRTWLLDKAGGNVPEENLALILSPAAGNEPKDVQAAEATNAGVLNAIDGLIKKSKGEGERLYFFYAGHGLTARINQRDENALVCSDFTEVLTTNSVALRSLWEFFETVQFQDQFFFVDACRNMPWENVELEIGRWPLPRKRDPGLPPTQQFILYATSPGLPAREEKEAGSERGAFTEVLMQGLGGAGKAKVWSSEKQNYQVGWERLVDYVKDELEARRLAVPAGVGQDVFQIPQDAGAHGVAGRDRDPMLASFPDNSFPKEKLEILLRPDDVVPVAEVIVLDESAVTVETKTGRTGTPLEFRLPPKTYALHATAPEYDRAVARPPIELYGACQVPLDLTPSALGEAPPAGNGAPTRSLGGEPAAAVADLVVLGHDPLVPVEVADATGRVLKVASGTVSLPGLAPGFYRARLLTPGDKVVEEIVEHVPGEPRTVELEAQAPSPIVNELVKTIDAPVIGGQNTFDVSEAAGPVASPHLSTILTLAGGVAVQGDPGYGEKLRKLGLGAFKDVLGADPGVYVVLGADSPDSAVARSYLTNAKLRVWRIGDPVPRDYLTLRELEKFPGIGEFAQSAQPGAYWLSLEPEGENAIAFALATLPRRVTMLTIELREGQMQIFQYVPSATPDASSDPAALRRVELLERIMLDGRLDSGSDLAQEVFDRKIDDPLAGALACYLFLRIGRVAELGEAVERLTSAYGELSDLHVIQGEYEAASGRPDAAKAAFARAIEVGVPIFGEGLTRLLEGMRTYELEHPLARLVSHIFEHHMSGSMWSVWLPEKLTPGELIVP
jgi:hypothetical protein